MTLNFQNVSLQYDPSYKIDSSYGKKIKIVNKLSKFESVKITDSISENLTDSNLERIVILFPK